MPQTLIIAEAGVNHNGDIEIAKAMIDIAAKAKADIIKFQTFKSEKCISKNAKKAEYQATNTDNNESQLEMVKKLELDVSSHQILIDYCKKQNIKFLSTPFDLESIDLLNNLGLDTFKIPSGEITNLPYLRKIARLNKQVILSTGMANLGEIEFALNVLTNHGTQKDNIIALHCNTEYPTPLCDVNLKAMRTIREAFKVKVGYSDHTQGIYVSIAAVAMGACIIEKHFTLDKNMQGPDHKASLEPNELAEMIRAIREIEISLGNGIKQASKSELKNKDIARKSIVATKHIKKGDVLNEHNLYAKRPGNGISPTEWDKVVGRKAIRDFDIDELIEI